MRSSIREIMTIASLGCALSAAPAYASEASSLSAGDGEQAGDAAASEDAQWSEPAAASPIAASITPVASNTAIVSAPIVSAASEGEAIQGPALERAVQSTEPLAESSFGGGNNDSPVTISGNATITTDYRFRGVSLSEGDFAVQGGLELGLPEGFYTGIWASSLPKSGGYGAAEVDFYGGWSGEIAEGLTFDTGLTYYTYIDEPPGDFDYAEFYSSLAYTLGPVEAKLGTAYAPSQDALSNDDNLYIYSDLSGTLPGAPLTITGHLGYTDGPLTYTADAKAWDYSLGAAWAFNEMFNVEAKYVAVDGPDRDPMGNSLKDITGDTVVFSVNLSF